VSKLLILTTCMFTLHRVSGCEKMNTDP